MVRPPMLQTGSSVHGRRCLLLGVMTAGLLLGMSPRLLADDATGGEQIYRQKCASCHGANGEGSKDYKVPLAGDRSVPQLARFIAKTMPEDDPGTCTGEEAERVAAYIHDAFYSKAAQARNAPPRVELSRLTVRQYRNAVADLIGTFRSPGNWDDKRGLHAEYFKSRRFNNGERVIERTDPTVKFDFGEGAPDPEKFEPSQFSIRWEGSVLAPESGDYEFIVKTEHSVRLWVNDPKAPLIDALVKSGNDTEYRATIPLLGGRAYPLKLEFSKAKQGVDDSKDKKNKPKPVKASIALEWKPPQRAAEVIPERNLSPGRSPRAFVSTAAFPPDDRSVGYERGTTISKAWDQATTDGAIEVAAYVASQLRDLSGVGDGGDDREKRLREFCGRFAERAFRRPLSDEQKSIYIDRQFEESKNPDLAVKRSVLLVLKSPRFLYREVGGAGPDAYDIASRLSFTLWDSLPDKELLEAAASGRLDKKEEVERQAERMVGDLRSRSKVRAFLLQWLRVEQAPDLSKDPAKFPKFDGEVASDLRASLDLFLDDVIWGESSDFRRLFTSDTLFLNGRLAAFYGADLPPDAPFQKVSLDAGERAGVLTHPYLLASFAYTATSSPIHRGVFLARSVLGRALRPPPEAFPPLAPDLHPDLNTRERVSLQTKPTNCQACHGMINPLGFTLEHFDAVGKYRAEEKGRPIDATGGYQARSGDLESFNGAKELAAYLAGSEEAHTAFVEQLFQYLVKQPIRAFGPRASADLRESFTSRDFHVRKLLAEIAASTAQAGRAAH